MLSTTSLEAEDHLRAAQNVRPMEPTDPAEIDALVARLDSAAGRWAAVDARSRAAMLRECLPRLVEVSDEWVAAACAAKGAPRGSAVEAEEWISGPMVTARFIRLLAHSLESLPSEARRAARAAPGGRAVVEASPLGLADRLLYPGVRADVWIAPGCEPTRGSLYSESPRTPRGVALVLGAGNVGSIPPLDILSELCVRDRVVVCKLNPVNEYLGPLLARIFSALIEQDFVALAYGGADVGRRLCHHDLVRAVHVTGSIATHDAIVWGEDETERAWRRESGRPLLEKPITSELGCVTPIIVVPGRWSPVEIEVQARRVASMVVHNASFNCNAAKVLVTPADWYLRGDFLDALRAQLRALAPRRAYYPGAARRYEAFLERYPEAEVLGHEGAGVVPWTLIPGVPARPGEYALSVEAFCGVLAECPLPSGSTSDAAGFLEGAVELCNDAIAGDLSCGMLVDDDTGARLGDGLERGLAALRYGAIGVNLWPAVVYAFGAPPWGAYPGNTLERAGSGIGFAHNALLLDHPEKTVARGPVVPPLTPPWFADSPWPRAIGPSITRAEALRSASSFARLALAAALG